LKLVIFAAFYLLALVGCSSISREDAVKIERVPENSSVIYANAEHRMMMIADPKNSKRFCAEPPPDASLSVTDSDVEKVSVLGKEEKMGDTASAVASSLGGRNSTVLLARDILYRACELSANTNANFEQSRELFLQSLKTIETLGNENQVNSFSKIGTTSTISENLGVNNTSTSTDAISMSDSKETTKSESKDKSISETDDSSSRLPASD
jgi:hypothetical protein